MSCRRLVLAFVCLATVGFADSEARAQGATSSSGATTTGGGASINLASGLTNPYRYLFQNGQYVDVTNTPRPQNLNPTGVNFTDCEQDLRLVFPLVISGFNGDHIEVWAGTLDCTQDANRTGSGAGVSHVCWQLAGAGQPIYSVSPSPITYTIYARDVLRYEQIPATTTYSQTWDPNFHSSSQGETACHVQTSDAAVPINIFFIPVQSTEAADTSGAAYQYPLNTDLVAPPPPPSVSLNPGDTLLKVSWTNPGDDPDIAGFTVWSDPPAGGATSGGCSCGGAPGTGANSYVGADAEVPGVDATTRCMDAESEAEAGESDGALEGATDAPGEAMESGSVEASMPEASSPEASMPMPEASTDGAPEASASDGGTDSGSASVPDGGGDAGAVNCSPINIGGGGGSCNSVALTGKSFVVGGGGGSVFTEGGTPVYDDAGNIISTGGEGGETLSGGGIAEIDPKYKGYELDDKVPSPITLTGLTNGHSYVVVVTSIDAFGNVGPVSTPQCGQPEPTSDFWKTYKGDNGSASGCALEAGDGSTSDLPLFAFAVAVTGAAFMRRRRTRR